MTGSAIPAHGPNGYYHDQSAAYSQEPCGYYSNTLPNCGASSYQPQQSYLPGNIHGFNIPAGNDEPDMEEGGGSYCVSISLDLSLQDDLSIYMYPSGIPKSIHSVHNTHDYGCGNSVHNTHDYGYGNSYTYSVAASPPPPVFGNDPRVTILVKEVKLMVSEFDPKKMKWQAYTIQLEGSLMEAGMFYILRAY